MSSEVVSMLVEKAIAPNVSLFLARVKELRHNAPKRHFANRSHFPIFEPANNEYFEYSFFENNIERYILDYLVNDVFISLLYETRKSSKIDCLVPSNNDTSDKRANYSRKIFLKYKRFAFIIVTNKERIGYCYSSECLSDDDLSNIDDIIYNYSLSRIEIIDWSNTDSLVSKNVAPEIPKEKRNKVQYVTLQKFMKDYFPDELFDEYLKIVRQAIKTANKEIGFQTIQQLSLQHLYSFKLDVLSEISTYDLCKLQYQIFDESNGKPSNTYYNLLPNEDRITLWSRFFSKNLFHALVGNEKFAQCFLTSEHLYKTYKSGNWHFFDYSTIATGYFKSVELLLEKMMELSLSLNDRGDLWIKCSDNNIHPDGPEVPSAKRICQKNNSHVKEIRFRKEFRDSFSTEMGALIYFLCDNRNHDLGWVVTWQGRKTIRKCLLNYNKGCRNEHLHKDIIDDVNAIDPIRNNTLLCLFYLLGGYNYNGNAQSHNPELLGIVDNSFDRLYSTLKRYDDIIDYYIQFHGQAAFKAMKTDNQDLPLYDDKGNLMTSVIFVRVDEFSIESYESQIDDDQNLVFLSRDNVPEKIWWYSQNRGRNEITW